eukprot:223774-Rhodomonas_salina.2
MQAEPKADRRTRTCNPSASCAETRTRVRADVDRVRCPCADTALRSKTPCSAIHALTLSALRAC